MHRRCAHSRRAHSNVVGFPQGRGEEERYLKSDSKMPKWDNWGYRINDKYITKQSLLCTISIDAALCNDTKWWYQWLLSLCRQKPFTCRWPAYAGEGCRKTWVARLAGPELDPRQEMPGSQGLVTHQTELCSSSSPSFCSTARKEKCLHLKCHKLTQCLSLPGFFLQNFKTKINYLAGV